jgi:putative transposase
MCELEIQAVKGFKAPKPSAIRKLINQAGTRVNLLLSLETLNPLEVAVTDFTEIIYANGEKKAFLMPMVGLVSKVVFGWAVGPRENTELALESWAKAKKKIQKFRRTKDFIVHHDQGSIYTSYRWLRQLAVKDIVKISYTLRGFKDNEEMESWNSRFKTENKSLFLDCYTLEELKKTIQRQIAYHNTKRRHSALGNLAPLKFLQDHIKIKKLG